MLLFLVFTVASNHLIMWVYLHHEHHKRNINYGYMSKHISVLNFACLFLNIMRKSHKMSKIKQKK